MTAPLLSNIQPPALPFDTNPLSQTGGCATLAPGY